MHNVLGIIFAESSHVDLGELTAERPLAAIPILGRFRLIDFPLSNMVNSGMVNVAVVTRDNYHSLMGHLESGKEWNLARKRYGLTLFPPFSNIDSGTSDSRIDILYGILGFLRRSTQDYVLLAESNVVANITFNEMFEMHKKSNADITVCYKKVKAGDTSSAHEAYLVKDDDGTLINVEVGNNVSGSDMKYNGYILINKNLLINIIEQAHVRGRKGFFNNILERSIGKYNINLYETTGYSRKISSIRNYYNCSMDCLNKDLRDSIFNGENWIFTKSKDTFPTRYLADAKVTNSLIGDGCSIDGTISNSVLFRNVHVGKGSKIENSIIMQECYIGDNVTLRNVILDKKVVIKGEEQLMGTSLFPVVVGKGKTI